MANGRRLDDNKFTCASWDYPLGTWLYVRSLISNRSCKVIVTDRGPAKRLYRKGRVLDLSKSAFNSIASLSEGVIPVSIEIVK